MTVITYLRTNENIVLLNINRIGLSEGGGAVKCVLPL